MAPPPHSVADATRWNAIDVVFRQSFQFVVTILLARLLAPEDFGSFAILSFLCAFAIIAIQNCLSLALIQRRDTTHEEESSIFWLSLGLSLAIGLAIAASGAWLARFYGQPVLQPLAALTALQLVLAIAGDVHTSLLSRDFRFRTLMRAGVTSIALSGCLALWLAWHGAGIWALSIQAAVAAGINSVILWLSSPWRPRLAFRLAAVQSAFAFGGWVAIGMVLDHAFTSAINLFAGKQYGVRALGYFNRGYALQSFAAATMTLIVGRVSLPLLASRQDDPAALRESMRLAIGSAMLFNVPAFVGLALVAEPTIVLLFGQRWLPAAVYVAPLALAMLWLPMHVINSQLAIARGLSRIYLRNELIKKALGIGCLAAGSAFGLVGMAWGMVGYGLAGLVVYHGTAYRDLGYGPARQIVDLWSVFVCAAVMVGAALLVRSLAIHHPLANLFTTALAGGTAYFATALALRSRQLADVLAILKTERNRHR